MSGSDFSVTEVPRRHGRTLLQTDRLALALRFAEGHVEAPSVRVVVWWPDPQPSPEQDVAVALPLGAYREWEERASEVVSAWEAKWLLIESMPSRHRDDARDDLHQAVANALVAAAITGVDARGAPDDLGF